MADYSIWVVEFATAPESLATFLLHGLPGVRELPYSITVLQSDEHTVLIDTGFIDAGDAGVLAKADGVARWTHPREAIARIGIDRRAVDTILLTHAHYDHLGDVDDYPNATVYLQRRELETWTWALSLDERFGWLKDGVTLDDVQAAVELVREGRLRLVEGAVAGVLPGVSLEPDFDTHTYGHQHVVVDNEADGRWVLPGDVVYSHQNLAGPDGSGRYHPIGYATGGWRDVLFAFDRIVQSVDGDIGRVIPGHDCDLWRRHASRSFDDGLHVAEITLRPGDDSRLPR
jgi:glyoxylase-like metal-dependent hydrolase (beta-lactamase superfamily II)